MASAADKGPWRAGVPAAPEVIVGWSSFSFFLFTDAAHPSIFFT
jgi:hypothetical protein